MGYEPHNFNLYDGSRAVTDGVTRIVMFVYGVKQTGSWLLNSHTLDHLSSLCHIALQLSQDGSMVAVVVADAEAAAAVAVDGSLATII